MDRHERNRFLSDATSRRTTIKPSSKAIYILIIVLLITLFNIYNGNFQTMSKKAISIAQIVREQQYLTMLASSGGSSLSSIPTTTSTHSTTLSVAKKTNITSVPPPLSAPLNTTTTTTLPAPSNSDKTNTTVATAPGISNTTTTSATTITMLTPPSISNQTNMTVPSPLSTPINITTTTLLTSPSSSNKTNDTVSYMPAVPNNTTTTTTTTPQPPSPYHRILTHYEQTIDPNFHYEFLFEYHENETKDDPRLVILLNGSVRICSDYWNFAVGRRILAQFRSFRFSILALCSKKKTYYLDGPVQNNTDVERMYTYLQKWINNVYYKRFQKYPRLYIHGVSRGSKIATLLCRVLPIQHQILTASLDHPDGIFVHSDYPIDLQKRLQLDSTFANWFYFDFCYKPTLTNQTLSELCPFQSTRFHYQPVPPTYFIQLQNDRFFNRTEYYALRDRLINESFALGGKLLNHAEAVKLYIIRPVNATPTYMQETFDRWHWKPYASAIFYEHYVNRSLYNATNSTRQTCPCVPTDFTYYELYPNITQTWPKQKQDEYKDYVRDVDKYVYYFCEDVCTDLHADHGMSSRHLDVAIEWMNKIDSLRQSLLVEDYVSRPLRIWMYNKTSIVTNNTYFASNQPDYVNIAKQYNAYSPEYYLQDYFKQLQASSKFSRRNLQWADNPLLADYFIIPSDLSYYYFHPDINKISESDISALVTKLNTEYFEILLTNIRTKFPYWTMAKQADQIGSNHILTILTGRSMGIFHNDTQKLLKNVIQIVFTGIRQDLLPPGAPPPRDYRGMVIVYRHGYDIVIPQFTRLISDSNRSLNIDELVKKKKKRLLFFAGALHHTMTPNSARPLISNLYKDMQQSDKNITTIEISGKRYETLTVIDGHQKPEEYVNSMQSTVFALCPEGFFPWSPRLYDALQLGAVPLILADNIVLPFERFIDWSSISVKINVSNIDKMIQAISKIKKLDEYTKKKLANAQRDANAFRWPYSGVGENGHKQHDFLPNEDKNGTAKNAFHYVSLELRCRRLEQLYGLTSDSFSPTSIAAQQAACTAHPTICPCHDPKRSLAFKQYL